MKVVVCDDDVTLRSVVTKLAETVGHSVIAETDVAGDAVELVTRFGADVLILDLSLPWGGGMDAIYALKQRSIPCQIVVFTAYADETPEVRDAGARAVVEKPDFEALEQVLVEIRDGVAAVPGVEQERRKTPRPRPRIPEPVVRAPSGFEEPDSFAAVVRVLEPGDVILYVHLTPTDGPALDPWTKLLQIDRLLAVARSLRTVLRVQDRLSVDDDTLVAVLLDAQRIGVESAWRRLERAHDLTKVAGILSGGWAVCNDSDPTYATQSRAREAARRSVGQPPGDRLWAG